MSKSATVVQSRTSDRLEDGYYDFLDTIRDGIEYACLTLGEPMFVVHQGNLFDVFLKNLPDEARQHYTCNACRKFVNSYGGLVAIGPDGAALSIMWNPDDAPEFFVQAVAAMKKKVENSPVAGIFLSATDVLGYPETNGWAHMSAVLNRNSVFRNVVSNPEPVIAAVRENRKMLIRSLQEYDPHTIRQAIRVLESDELNRSGKFANVASWFSQLAIACKSSASKRRKDNILWRAAATAPVGFSHIRSSMLGTLLNDIKDGKSFGQIKARFNEKVTPTKYQRPQAPPKAGNVAEAEKIIAEKGLALSLQRRYARLEEITAVWTPSFVVEEAHPQQEGGIFSHLVPKGSRKPESVQIPARRISWRKFEREVLPSADSMKYVPANERNAYGAILAAVHPDSPPIFKWDKPDLRNPFSWYVWSGGSRPENWHLNPGIAVDVNAVALFPSLWNPGYEHLDMPGVFFILDGAWDENHEGVGVGLFPEILSNDAIPHSIRSTIEAYSESASLEGAENATACGVAAMKGICNVKLIVVSDGEESAFHIDCWDH